MSRAADFRPPLVSVVLPTWNTRDDVIEFLESLDQQSYPRAAMEVVIADNGSTDGSAEAIRAWFAGHAAPWHRLELVELGENRGIAAGYNAAYAACSPEAFAILRAESDVLLSSGVGAALVKVLQDLPDAGVAGAKGMVHGSPGRVEHAARYINWWTGSLHSEEPATRVDCDAVFGSTFMARRACIERLGSFFPADRFLADELAFCSRVKRLGYRVLYEPAAVAYHKIARSSGNLDRGKFAYISYREQTLFHLAYNPFPQKAVYLAVSLLWCMKRAAQGEGMFLRGFRDGLRLGWLHRPGRLPGTSGTTEVAVSEWLARPDRFSRG